MPYVDNATFIPGTGAVLIASPGETVPTVESIQTWLNTTTGDIGNFTPLGHTSVDDLPKIEGETEGGEKKGSWENDSLRTTPIKTSTTITVTPIQWTADPLKHRFGKDGAVDETEGTFTIPDIYTASEVAMLIIIRDGSGFIAFYFPKVSSAPEGGIELDPENFAGMPVKYTVLKMQGKSAMVISPQLKTGTTPART